MKEKSPQEEKAAVRQVQLINEALNKAKDNGGVWLNKTGMTAPRIYPKGPAVSPFNALVLQLNADKHEYPSSQYMFFHTAKATGNPVLGKEAGVPFNWYAWDKYVDRHNPEKVITAEEYKKLTPEQQAGFKGVQQRQIRILFNLAQTTMPFGAEDKYRQVLDRFGTSNERGNLKAEERQLRTTVNGFIKQMKDYLVPVRREASEVAHYDTEKDAVYLPDQKKYAEYPEYVQELMRQIVSATGHQQRLAREGMVMKGGKSPGDYADRYERLVVEVASALKMNELGLPAKLSPQNISLVDKWTLDLQENPCMLDALEADVNNALDVIRKAERGEKIEYASFRTQSEIDSLREAQKPQVDAREAAILADILRHGGMVIPDGNFRSSEERQQFLEKFSLDYYDKNLREALTATKSGDPETIELAYGEALKNAAHIERLCREYFPKQWDGAKAHYLVTDMIDRIPNMEERSFVVVKDGQSKVYDVILPGGASTNGHVVMPDGERKLFRISPDEVMSRNERKAVQATVEYTNSPGMAKDRIEAAMKRDGASYVRFFNPDGVLGYAPGDAYFEGKSVHEMKCKGQQISEVATYDISDAVKAAGTVLFNKVQMLKDDNGRWAMFVKPKDAESFCVFPEKDDINRFFSTLRQGNQEEADRLRMELGQKYFEIANVNPQVKFDMFGDVPEGVDIQRITRVNVYKTNDNRIMCAPKIEGEDKVKPREITRDQWNRMFMADDMGKYKTALAARVFADVLNPELKAEVRDEVKEETKVEVEETEEVVVSKGIGR